jgi:hypothetical protein
MLTAAASKLLALALFSLSWPSGISWRVLLPKNVTFDSMRDIENEVDVFAFGGNHQGQVVPGSSLHSPRFLDRNLDFFSQLALMDQEERHLPTVVPSLRNLKCSRRARISMDIAHTPQRRLVCIRRY